MVSWCFLKLGDCYDQAAFLLLLLFSSSLDTFLPLHPILHAAIQANLYMFSVRKKPCHESVYAHKVSNQVLLGFLRP